MKKCRFLRPCFLIITIHLFLANANISAQTAWVIVNPAHDLENTPVSVVMPSETIPDSPLCMITGNSAIPAQAEKTEDGRLRFWWQATQKAGTSVRYELSAGNDCDAPRFFWTDAGERSARLNYRDKPVISYVYPVYDPEDVENTLKPFHHVFSPDGTRKITKGPGGLYSHHRGIFLGYNHVYVNDKSERIDIWHARNGERSEHEAILSTFEGPVTGGHIVRIAWKDHDGKPFIEEKRKIRVHIPNDEELIVDLRSELVSLKNKVVLDGDRHHAGLQFRAAQYVADNRETSRYIRPESWEDVPPDVELGDENLHDFPWNALYFRVEGHPYTVTYFSHPDNPGGAEMSERLYGRFGEFFPYELGLDESIVMKYRFRVTSGDPPSRQDIQAQFEKWIQKLTIRPD